MRNLSTKFRLAAGLSGLVVSLLMVTIFAGIVPDKVAAMRDARASLAESIAVNASLIITQADLRRMQALIELVVERNDDLLSSGLRRKDGQLTIATRDHDTAWQPMLGERSNDTQVMVPVWAGTDEWGQLELRFEGLTGDGLDAIVRNPWIRQVMVLGLGSFLLFYFYLSKALKHLDPSRAIPGRVQEALDTMAEGLLVIDSKQNIALANRAFAKLLEKTPHDLVGSSIGKFPWLDLEGVSVDLTQSPWSVALHEGVPQMGSMLKLQLPDARWRTFMINASPVMGSGSKRSGVLISFDDVTELEEKEIELRRSKDRAEAANVAKSAFLANMSHEIRTPMNAILGFTEVLRRGWGKDASSNQQHLATIQSSGKHLLELINDILDLSKIESGRLEVESAQVAPHKVLHDVAQIMQVKAHEKGIGLEFSIDTAIPEFINADAARLRQIVTNLVGNAIKFTDQGGVAIRCDFQEGVDGPVFHVAIADSGIGMSADKLDSVFDPFVQADTSITRRFGGTGLGLSISRRLARAMNGNITVESTLGQGSTFHVTIPTGDLAGVAMLAPSEIVFAAADQATAKTVNWRFPNARVLVVDDGAENRGLVKLLLEEVGLSVAEAENGKEGYERALQDDYAAILMDVQMPVMDGFTATRKIRSHGLEIPIIALTANAMKGFEEECRAVGYSDYVSKPIDVDNFISRMAETLGAVAEEVDDVGRILDQVAADQLPEPSLAPIDSSPIFSSYAGRFGVEKLIRRFVDKLDTQLPIMEQALQKADWQALASMAHWLKGSAGTLGFGVMTEPAIDLEQAAKDNDSASATEAFAVVTALAGRLQRGAPAEAATAQSNAKPTDCAATDLSTISTDTSPIFSSYAGRQGVEKLIGLFVEKLNAQLPAMEQALQKADWQALARMAHWLKGSAGTLGFGVMTEPAIDLEQAATDADAARSAQAFAVVHALAGRLQAGAPAIDAHETAQNGPQRAAGQ